MPDRRQDKIGDPRDSGMHGILVEPSRNHRNGRNHGQPNRAGTQIVSIAVSRVCGSFTHTCGDSVIKPGVERRSAGSCYRWYIGCGDDAPNGGPQNPDHQRIEPQRLRERGRQAGLAARSTVPNEEHEVATIGFR